MTETETRVAISGASGRMGRTLIQAVSAQKGTRLVQALDRVAHGEDAGVLAGLPALGVPVTAHMQPGADVFIDFSRPDATLAYLPACAEHATAMVIGTTGFQEGQLDAIRVFAEQHAVVMAPNMSIGVNVVMHLLRTAASILGEDSDIEVIEAHHRHKVDAPSGTALRMGETIAGAMGRRLDEVAVYSRDGIIGERRSGSIGFSTIRAADIVGEHTVMFAAEGERVEITHKASSRMNFARGAVQAACWLRGKKTGLYSMDDVLGM